MLKVFVIVRFRDAPVPGIICPKLIFPGPRSKPMFSPTMNLVEIVCLFSGVLRDIASVIIASVKNVIIILFFLSIFIA